MAETLTIRTASSTEVVKIAVQGPQGPAGAPGTGLETLTTKGDTLFRGQTTGERLPIGSVGQVMKVSSGGVPHWANESGAVTSVNGQTGEVTLTAADVAAAEDNHSHNSSEIEFNGVEISGAGSANANGVFVLNGTLNGRGIYYKSKDDYIYWETDRWFIASGSDDLYASTGNTSALHPWQVGGWSVIAGVGAAPAPSFARINGNQYELVIGQRTNPTLRGDAAGKNVGTGANDVAAGNHTHSAVTQSVAGFLSAADKTKLDGIAANATANTASSATPSALGTPSAGSATDYARADHVHAMPTANDLGLGSDDTVTFGGVVIVDAEDGLSLTQSSIQHSSGFFIDAEASNQSATTFSGPIDFGGADPSVTKTTVRSNLGLGSAATANLNAISDADFRIVGSTDATKKVAIEVDTNVPANTTVTLTAPSASGTLALAGAAPSAHAASHAAAGSDALAPSDIGAQSVFAAQVLVVEADQTLTASRAKNYALQNYGSGPFNLTLPITNNMTGDVVVVRNFGTFVSDVVIRQQLHDGTQGGPQFTTLATILGASGGNPPAQQYRFIKGNSNNFGGWSLVAVDTHTHAAADITSGTLDIARIPTGTNSTQVALGNHTHTPSEVGLGNVSNTAQVTSVTGTAPIVSSGGTTPAISVTVGTGANTVAAGDDSRFHTRSHAITSTSDHTATANRVFYSDNSGNIQEVALGSSGTVLTSNGATSAPSFAAASGGGVTAVGASTADVLSVSGSDLVADDGGLIDSSDPFIKWDDAAGKLVYANPLSRPTGSFYVGLAPTTTGLGTRAINIQGSRSAANQVAADPDSIVIGTNARAFSGGAISRQVVVGASAIGEFRSAVAIGGSSSAKEDATAIGDQSSAGGSASVAVGIMASASAPQATALGRQATASGDLSLALGSVATASGFWSTACGTNITANLRGQFMTRPFGSVFWGGQTTNNTATILNLDAAATNRFTIAANTALAVDILLVARRATTQDKWLVARRFVGIRRDGSNNTSLIGTVQEVAPDQSAGSPTWTYAITADDTNEALQLEVTGATGETVEWRATAFYRVA